MSVLIAFFPFNHCMILGFCCVIDHILQILQITLCKHWYGWHHKYQNGHFDDAIKIMSNQMHWAKKHSVIYIAFTIVTLNSTTQYHYQVCLVLKRSYNEEENMTMPFQEFMRHMVKDSIGVIMQSRETKSS